MRISHTQQFSRDYCILPVQPGFSRENIKDIKDIKELKELKELKTNKAAWTKLKVWQKTHSLQPSA
jgi:predicted CoA-binding protein